MGARSCCRVLIPPSPYPNLSAFSNKPHMFLCCFFACVQFLPHPPPRPTPPHFIWLFKKCFVPEVVFCCSFVFPRVSSSVALLSFFCIFVTSHWLNGELPIRSSHFSAPYPHPFLAQTFFYHHYYVTSLLCSHPLAAKHANISDPQKISPKLYI